MSETNRKTDLSETLKLHPIGVFHADSKFTYDVPRQGVLAGDNVGVVELEEQKNYEQALEYLDGFSYIWLIFWFHHNTDWHAKVQPPRHLNHKVGVFASRSPYRPNPIGMSAVRLLAIKKRKIYVLGHDLLENTPILDIKPYIAYADAFPDATPGWTALGDTKQYEILFLPKAEEKLQWLEQHGVTRLRPFILDQLSMEPDNRKHHRLIASEDDVALAYRTWRIPFTVKDKSVEIIDIISAYSIQELQDAHDIYADKTCHRQFVSIFG